MINISHKDLRYISSASFCGIIQNMLSHPTILIFLPHNLFDQQERKWVFLMNASHKHNWNNKPIGFHIRLNKKMKLIFVPWPADVMANSKVFVHFVSWYANRTRKILGTVVWLIRPKLKKLDKQPNIVSLFFESVSS